MNRVIGLCVKTRDYPSTFADYGYQVQLIEQSFTTEGGEQVKPDIVVASERCRHIICFDCKGGHTVERDQIDRYRTLTPNDLSRWIRLRSAPASHNLCFTFRELERLNPIIQETSPHPLLILGDDSIAKIRDFSVSDLNNAFNSPVSLAGKHPPVSYYPFSDQDNDIVIFPIVLRKIVQLALNKHRGGPSALDTAIFDSPQIVESTHPYWDALSNEHRNRLANRVKTILRRLMANETELRNHLETLESREGFKVLGPLVQLQRVVEKIIERDETQPQLNRFLR